jgi:hypothetical protein
MPIDLANVKDYGATGDGSTNDSSAIQDAVDAGIGIYFPPGDYEFNGINIDGSDVNIVAPPGAFLKDTVHQDGTSMFIFAANTTVDRLVLDIHRVRIDAGGGHVFEIKGNFNHSSLKCGHIDQNATGKSIIDHDNTGFYFNRVEGINWAITTSHTVPAINMSSQGNMVSANVFDIMRPDRSGSVPYMHLLNSISTSYNYNNIISLRNPEVCNGGLIKTSRSFGTVLRDINCFDNGTITNHMIEIGQDSLVCQNTRIENYQRNAGSLSSGKYDIKATNTNTLYIENPHGVSNGQMVEIDINNEPNTMVVGGGFYNVVNAAPGNSLTCDAGGGIAAPRFNLSEQGGSLKISSGAITVTDSVHRIDTEGLASTDTLKTINGGRPGQLLILKSVSDARDITVEDATGNIFLNGDFTFTRTQDVLMLMYDALASGWVELSRADNRA